MTIEFGDKIKKYFAEKTKELIALSEQAISSHGGLNGAHRENIIKRYLREIIPKRYGIGNGIVYGTIGKSKECDIAIWDELNYPKIQLLGHTNFFAEAVKMILEIKTHWNKTEFQDVNSKNIATKEIFHNHLDSLSNRMERLENQFASLVSGMRYSGDLISPHKICTASLFFNGGEKFDIEKLTKKERTLIEDGFPDIIAFLGSKKVVVKDYEYYEEDPLAGGGVLIQYDSNDDTLLLFTSFLLDSLYERTNSIDEPLNLTNYVWGLKAGMKVKSIGFNMTRHVPGRRKPIFGT